MKSTSPTLALGAVLLLRFVCNCLAQTLPRNAAASLGGTSWQLMKFQESNDNTLTPHDKTKYTIAFESDGSVSVRIDCNRGHRTWRSSAPNQLEFGPFALTRAMCPPAPFNDRIPEDWEFVRSYIVKDAQLFLLLMVEGGTYEFERIGAEGLASGQVTLESTHWKLTRLGETPVTSPSQQQEPQFALEGLVALLHIFQAVGTLWRPLRASPDKNTSLEGYPILPALWPQVAAGFFWLARFRLH
jgi:heat shock protein HslJ